jgi:formiminoglutamate deiminase
VTDYRCEAAWLDGAVEYGVTVRVDGERISAVHTGQSTPDGPDRPVPLRGLVLPGFANAHSHAFHRALRGRTHGGAGDFWSWREAMYAVAGRLTPESYEQLATAVYAEMALAGITCVGEFHYLHHQTGGHPYADPNEMAHRLIGAAARAGIRITLLDTCYLTGGIGAALSGVQHRFGDGDPERWAERVTALANGAATTAPHARVGVAVHSLRAVPLSGVDTAVELAGRLAAPLHVHLSEQPAENRAVLAAYGRTPTQALADRGALGPGTTVVHGTHLTQPDVALLGGSAVCLCPTTERELADGIGPAPELAGAGAALVLGSDSHAVIDMFEEARAVELDERLRSGRRGTFAPATLLRASTVGGHASLGRPDAGRIAAGQYADLVAVDTASVRTAGCDPAQLVFAAAAADVTDVVASGRHIVRDGVHQLLPHVAAALTAAIRAVAG